jgi:hypothetical protein
MKTTIVKSLAFAFIAFMGSSVLLTAKAQKKETTPKVFAVINRADWCPVCQANGAKVMNDVIPACMNLSVKFLPNDLTNNETTAKSASELKKYKVYSSVKDTKSTGLILLIDARTKKIIKQISMAEPAEEIIKNIKEAQI